jgi:hypothetical protein
MGDCNADPSPPQGIIAPLAIHNATRRMIRASKELEVSVKVVARVKYPKEEETKSLKKHDLIGRKSNLFLHRSPPCPWYPLLELRHLR